MLLERGGDPDFVKVLDFGLVKMVTEPSDADGGRQRQLTQSGILMGSPRYMSPEQVGGKDLDHRADIYSFGALLCFALTGQPPFHAGSQFEAMRAHVYTEAPRLRELHPECAASERLEALVLGCLQKDPNARPQTMVAIREELRACALAPRAADQGDARPTLGRGVPVQEGSSSSLFSQAIVNPGSSKVAWGIRFAVIALFLVAGAGLALLIPRPTAEPIATPLGSVTAEAATAEAVEPATPEPATPEPARITIDVSSVPVGARIVRMDPDRGDRVLGTAPVSLNLATTDRVALSISAPGYLAQTVYVDTSQPVVEVRLTEAPTEMPVSGDRPTMRPSLQADGDPTPAEREAREATDVPMVDNNGPIRDPWR